MSSMSVSPLFCTITDTEIYIFMFKKNMNMCTNILMNMLNLYPYFITYKSLDKFKKRFLDEFCIYKKCGTIPFNGDAYQYILNDATVLSFFKKDNLKTLNRNNNNTIFYKLKEYDALKENENAFDHYPLLFDDKDIEKKETREENFNSVDVDKVHYRDYNLLFEEFFELVLQNDEITKEYSYNLKYNIINFEKKYNVEKKQKYEKKNITLNDLTPDKELGEFLVNIVSLLNNDDLTKYSELMNQIKRYFNKIFLKIYDIEIYSLGKEQTNDKYERYLRFRYELFEQYYFNIVIYDLKFIYIREADKKYSRISYLSDNNDLDDKILSIARIPNFEKDLIEKYGEKSILPFQVAYIKDELITQNIGLVKRELLKQKIKKTLNYDDNIIDPILDDLYITEKLIAKEEYTTQEHLNTILCIILLFVKIATFNYKNKYYKDQDPNDNNSYIFIKMASSSLGLGIVICKLLLNEAEIDTFLNGDEDVFKTLEPIFKKFKDTATKYKLFMNKILYIVNLLQDGFIYQEISRGMCEIGGTTLNNISCYGANKEYEIPYYTQSLAEEKDKTYADNEEELLSYSSLIDDKYLTHHNHEGIPVICINSVPIKMRIFLFCMWSENDFITLYPDILNFEELIPIRNRDLLTGPVYKNGDHKDKYIPSINRYVSNNLSSLGSNWSNLIKQMTDLNSPQLRKCYNDKLLNAVDSNGRNFIEKFNISLNKTMAKLLTEHIKQHKEKTTKYSFYKNTIGLYCIDVVLANDDKVLQQDENKMKIIDINNFGAFMNPLIVPYYLSVLSQLANNTIEKNVIIEQDNIELSTSINIYPQTTTYICKNKNAFVEFSDQIVKSKYLKYKQKYLTLKKLLETR